MFIQFEAKHMLYKIEGSLYFIKLHVCELIDRNNTGTYKWSVASGHKYDRICASYRIL